MAANINEIIREHLVKSINEIIREYLVKNHFDGLCNPGICGCDLYDLMACCESNATACVTAYRFDCSRCLDGPDFNNDCQLCDGDDYMMATDLDFCHPMYVGGDE